MPPSHRRRLAGLQMPLLLFSVIAFHRSVAQDLTFGASTTPRSLRGSADVLAVACQRLFRQQPKRRNVEGLYRSEVPLVQSYQEVGSHALG